MKFKSPLRVGRDTEKFKSFYRNILGIHVIMDFNANVIFTGDSYRKN